MMCGRYAIFTEDENEEMRQIINEINERYKADNTRPQLKTGEIFPTDTVPALCSSVTGTPQIKLLKWGFPGFSPKPSVIINARCETLSEKPMFRSLILKNRCLIPASAFFEWKKQDSKKEKYIISPSDRSTFYMGGLYNTFTGKDGRIFDAFVIITTDANPNMLQIHNRMPVIIEKENEGLWLANGVSNIKELNSILRPYDKPLALKVS